MVHTTTIHQLALPAGHQIPQWTSRQCPRLGYPALLIQQCQSPSSNPEKRGKICELKNAPATLYTTGHCAKITACNPKQG